MGPLCAIQSQVQLLEFRSAKTTCLQVSSSRKHVRAQSFQFHAACVQSRLLCLQLFRMVRQLPTQLPQTGCTHICPQSGSAKAPHALTLIRRAGFMVTVSQICAHIRVRVKIPSGVKEIVHVEASKGGAKLKILLLLTFLATLRLQGH